MLAVYKTFFPGSTVYKLQNINNPDLNEASVTMETAATSKQHHLLHPLFQRLPATSTTVERIFPEWNHVPTDNKNE